MEKPPRSIRVKIAVAPRPKHSNIIKYATRLIFTYYQALIAIGSNHKQRQSNKNGGKLALQYNIFPWHPLPPRWWVVGRVIRVFTVMTAVMVPDGDIITVMGNSFDHSHSQQSQQASSPQTLPPTLHPLPSPPPRRMWEWNSVFLRPSWKYCAARQEFVVFARVIDLWTNS